VVVQLLPCPVKDLVSILDATLFVRADVLDIMQQIPCMWFDDVSLRCSFLNTVM